MDNLSLICDDCEERLSFYEGDEIGVYYVMPCVHCMDGTYIEGRELGYAEGATDVDN